MHIETSQITIAKSSAFTDPELWMEMLPLHSLKHGTLGRTALQLASKAHVMAVTETSQPVLTMLKCRYLNERP